jgi:hypothetical protein
VADRKIDYQVWCGPSMGAFNEWAQGTFLEQPKNRKIVTVALNILLFQKTDQRLSHSQSSRLHNALLEKVSYLQTSSAVSALA